MISTAYRMVILDLLSAAETALEYIDGYRDTATDPDSDIGEQVPNRACHVYQLLKEASELVDDQYDAEVAQSSHETAVCRAEYQEER
jgi:hypothetical protein